MKYILIKKNDIDFSQLLDSIEEILLELDDEGNCIREIGLNLEGKIIHIYPSREYKNGKYGFFDLAPFETNNLKPNLSQKLFDHMLQQAASSNLTDL